MNLNQVQLVTIKHSGIYKQTLKAPIVFHSDHAEPLRQETENISNESHSNVKVKVYASSCISQWSTVVT